MTWTKTPLHHKLRAQEGGVHDPGPNYPPQCWAEKRVYTGSLSPVYVNCTKAARRGHLTCHWHADREEEAQALRRALSIELRERDVLFSELHHRIANQLHAITGALELARRRSLDPNAQAELDKAVGRIVAMVETNRQLSL